MYWIDDLMGGPRYKKDSYLAVYELLSEAKISGAFEFFGGNLIIHPLLTDRSEDGVWPYQIMVRLKNDAKHSVAAATKKGYFHIEGIAGELVALLSLFYRARFYLRSTTTSELSLKSHQLRRTRSILRVNIPEWNNPSVLSADKGNFLDFDKLLWKLLRLPKQQHLGVINACTHYGRALREIGIDEEMAFVRLVSSIEALSKDFVLAPSDDPLLKADLAALLNSYEANERQEIESILGSRKAMLRFVRFVECYSKGYFKGGNYASKSTKIFREQLPKVLKAIYSARSKYLHEGESMYISRPFAGHKFDTDPSTAMYIGERKFTSEQKLPSLEFFDGLVRHCILRYIDAHLKPRP